MDKQKNVCYNYIGNRCKAWEAIMISLEEIASRLVDRKDYDFSHITYFCYESEFQNQRGQTY